MAITHNLSSNSDPLSGFDPTSGIADGITVGRSWIMWKVFEGFSAQFTNFVKITNSAPTPTFLRGHAGSNLQTEPLRDRAVTGDTIRFYNTNDPGLALATPQAMIYEWRVIAAGVFNQNLIDARLSFLVSGGTLYNPISTLAFLNNEQILTRAGYAPTMPNTTTLMANVPKCIFWKSSNLYMMMAIDKTTGGYRGFHAIYNGAFTGYKHNVGAITHDGTNLDLAFMFSGEGTEFIEGVSSSYYASTSTLSNTIVMQSSIGTPPSSAFTYSAKNNIIGGYMRWNLLRPTDWKVLTDNIEGVIVVGSGAVSTNIGSIQSYNSKYYLIAPALNDGATNTQRLLFEIGT